MLVLFLVMMSNTDAQEPQKKALRNSRPTGTSDVRSGSDKDLLDAYARIMRYQEAGQKMKDAQTGNQSTLKDRLTIKVSDIHTGELNDLTQYIGQVMAERSDEVLNIEREEMCRMLESCDLIYDAGWIKASDKSSQFKYPSINDVDHYTTYAVTTYYKGSNKTHKGAILYYKQPEKGYQIVDGLIPSINKVTQDRLPQAKAPWSQYVEKRKDGEIGKITARGMPPRGSREIKRACVTQPAAIVRIADFNRVVPRKVKTVTVTTTPSSLPQGMTVTLSSVRTNGNFGAATIISPSNGIITGTTNVQIRGDEQSWGSGVFPAPRNMQLQATLSGRTAPEATKNFIVSAFPISVQSNAHRPINNPSKAGMQTDILVKSDSGTDGDLDKVLESENVSLSYGAFGSAEDGMLVGTSGYQDATAIPPDNYDILKNYVIDRYDNHGGDGRFYLDQLDSFIDLRSNDPAVATPNSGYKITFYWYHTDSGHINLTVTKAKNACSVGGFSSAAGPSNSAQDTVQIR